ncbi:MAG: DUF6159 family protein [Candidatus Thermoplasmatota archaeon]
MKTSFDVLRKDKEILLFPVFSFIACVVLIVSFIGGFIFLGLPQLSTQPVIPVVLMFVLYILLFFVVIFFNTAVVACAHIRLNGGDPRVADGLHAARENIVRIFLWAVISATIGVILQAIRERSGWVGRIIVGLVGITWTYVTFFIIPVLIFEKRSMGDSIRRSATLFRQTWGETLVGSLGFGGIFFLLFLLGVVPLVLGMLFGNTILLLICVATALLYWAVLGAVASAINGIYVAALYQYATTKKLPDEFDASMLPPTAPGFM